MLGLLYTMSVYDIECYTVILQNKELTVSRSIAMC